MTLFNFVSSLFSSRRDRSTGRGRDRSRTRLALEQLEDRLVPTTLPVLNPGQVLNLGDDVKSPNGQFHLWLRGDGDLIEYDLAYGYKLWESNTGGKGVVYAQLQRTDGNFVLYGAPHPDGSPNAIWGAGTDKHPGDVLRVQDDGNVVIYQGGSAIWSTHTAGADAGLYLTPGQSVYSPNGNFYLTLQTNGDLVERGPLSGHGVSHTNGQRVIEAILQTDGNLVLYGPNYYGGFANPVWASNTAGHEFAQILLTSDGVSILDAGVIWQNGRRV
jgi:pseudomonalisin